MNNGIVFVEKTSIHVLIMGQNKESKKVDLSDGNNLKELAAQKEQEWKDLQELRYL